MDVVTTVIMLGLVNVMLAIALLVQSHLNRQFAGVRWWAAGQTLIAVGLVISAFRGASGMSKLAIPVWQVTTIAGFALVYVGVLRFFGRRERWAPLVALLAALTLWACFFTYVVQLVPPRSTAIYVCAGSLVFACAHAIGKWGRPFVGRSATFLRGVFSTVGGVYAVLAVLQASRWSSPQGMLAENPLYTTAYVATTCGTVLWVIGLIFMVNERLQNDVATQAENLTRIFATSPDCAIISRLADGLIMNVNEGFTRVTGYSAAEAIGRSSFDLSLWPTPADRERMVERLKLDGECENLPVMLRRKDGGTVECLLAARTLNLDGEAHVISLTRDVTEQRALEARLKRDATTDALTGVANRRHFLTLAQHERGGALPQPHALCVAVIDIDGFKQINDIWGHAAGDAALMHFARISERDTRETDTIGRLGGDEFGLLLPDTDIDRAFDIVDRIRQELLQAPVPDIRHDRPLSITISAGVAAFQSPTDEVQDVIAHADSALYEAKAQGRNRTVVAR